MQDTLTILRPNPMQHHVLGSWLRVINDESRDAIVSNIRQRQETIEQIIAALAPIFGDLQRRGVPLAEKAGTGVIYEAKEMLNAIDSAMSGGDGVVKVLDDLFRGDDSNIKDAFWSFNDGMFSALDRFLPDEEPADA